MKRPPRYDVPNAAPPPLRLVQLFINTYNHETGRELLGSRAALVAWLRSEGLAVGRASAADLSRAHVLREELRTAVTTGSAALALDDAARRARLTISFDEPRLVPQASGVDAALGTIATSVYEAMRDGGWARLKTCRNCGWAFWDKSKNRSAAWCSMQLCGSRAKVRRYRRRVSASRSA